MATKEQISSFSFPVYTCAEEILVLASSHQVRTDANVGGELICEDIRNRAGLIAENVKLIFTKLGDYHPLPWPPYQDTLWIRNMRVLRLHASALTANQISLKLKDMAEQGITNVSQGDTDDIVAALSEIITQSDYIIQTIKPVAGDPLKGSNPPPPYIPT